jgi:hypothetical protein
VTPLCKLPLKCGAIECRLLARRGAADARKVGSLVEFELT